MLTPTRRRVAPAAAAASAAAAKAEEETWWTRAGRTLARRLHQSSAVEKVCGSGFATEARCCCQGRPRAAARRSEAEALNTEETHPYRTWRALDRDGGRTPEIVHAGIVALNTGFNKNENSP